MEMKLFIKLIILMMFTCDAVCIVIGSVVQIHSSHKNKLDSVSTFFNHQMIVSSLRFFR